MTSIAGKNGNVYIATTIIDDCEDDWVDGTHGTAAPSTDCKVGSYSIAITGNGVVSDDVLAYEAIEAGATNYSTFTHVLCWAKCNATRAAADLRLALDVHVACATPETLLDFPALTADTWKYCHLTEVEGSLMSASTGAVYVGLVWHGTAADKIVYLDDIRAAKNIAGINNWTIDYVCDPLETTDFAAAGTRSYIGGCTSWAGTFAGYKDGLPLSIGLQYGGEFAESATTTQMWLGTIYITGVHPHVDTESVVTYSYDFQGSGALTIAST